MDVKEPVAPGSAEPAPPANNRSTIGVLAIAIVSIVCCSFPLLAAAIVTTGFDAWLLAHDSLLAVPVAAIAAGLFWWRFRQQQRIGT